MADKTGLERQEEDINLLFGNPQGLGMGDKSMLEMTDTNRLVIDSNQSSKQIAVEMLHKALVEIDNFAMPTYKRMKDEQTGEYYMVLEIVDNWAWLKDLKYAVQTNQLTIRGYSRSQHLRQSASMTPVAPEEEQQNIFQRLFGR